MIRLRMTGLQGSMHLAIDYDPLFQRKETTVCLLEIIQIYADKDLFKAEQKLFKDKSQIFLLLILKLLDQ